MSPLRTTTVRSFLSCPETRRECAAGQRPPGGLALPYVVNVGVVRIPAVRLLLQPAQANRFSGVKRYVPLGFALSVGSASVGSSGQGWRGYWPRMSFLTSA